MPPNDKAGRVVFIGNIPYGGNEEIIIETLGRVGQVLNFRLVYDKETGRPKGFGFAEFADPDSAASAVRNLNDYELMGRKLRVDWSNDNGAGDNAPATSSAPVNGQADMAAAPQSAALPPLPPGAELQPNLSCPDSISSTLNTLPPPQLLDIIAQMKGLVMTEPAKATELFRQAPQLAYAIFQALLLLNLVDTNVLGQLIDPNPQPIAAPPPQVQPPAPQPPRPPQNYVGYPPQPVPTPPQVVQQPYGQPPPAAQPQLTPEQLAAYQAVMNLSQQQIDALDPASRVQIMAVRQQFAGLVGGRV
ncbi:hypothetical protein BU23DRAFT_445807 [Bimuria novae-zelandiae CBS 107.79]|uniref:RRM domain-containing protein n=1 Tax=Bimuria novae-zelandiae CBS 107.79 TaxID=1447943 RepID=A0A6A5VVZ6_9PLEO|nr:hypothetical protein BU23DRAFT_445807 [Bimuria novae-zelandiae CBS 107.79]